VLTQLGQVLNKNGGRGGRAYLKAVKEKLGTAATQGEWPATLREMEKRISNHTAGI